MAFERLSAEDRLMLWPDAIWPQDVGALALFDGANLVDADGIFQIAMAREAVARRLHLLPRLRQCLHRPPGMLGGPVWVDSQTFDLRDHVNVIALPAPSDEAALLGAVEMLRRRRLDFSRPLWEMWFLTGLPQGRVAMFVRMHHVVGDGMAGVAAIGMLLDTDQHPAVAPAHPWSPAPMPSAPGLLLDSAHAWIADARQTMGRLSHPADVFHEVGRAWPVLRELTGSKPGPPTSLSHLIGGGRTMALVRSSLDEVRGIARAHDATINDVLLAATAGGLRSLLITRGESVEDLALPIYVPVSLRREIGGGDGGNLITQMVIPLPLGISDPGERLRHIAQTTAQRKATARPSLGALFRSKLITGVMLKLIARQRVNLVSANIPGPPMPLYFAGAQMLEIFPMVNLIGTVSLGIAAMSYAGGFTITAIADGDTYPDLDVLAAGLRGDLDVLAAARQPALATR